MKIKVLTIFGTRPEAIKMAPIIQKIKFRDSKFKSIVCVTAQHRTMLDQVLKIFNISPDYDLDIMRKNQDLLDITINSLEGLNKVLRKEKPDIVLVQGDTTTAFIAGLLAYYHRICLGHIESGLRTYNKYKPFPEEKNRHLLSVLSDMNFAPTEWAKSNLLREGILPEKIWVTGNSVIDSVMMINNRLEIATCKKRYMSYFKEKWNLTLSDENFKLILVTGHRRESFGEGFKNICMAIREIADRRKDIIIVYPVHLNPNVQEPVRSILAGKSNIHLIEPLDYEPFIFLMKHSYFILTDSGGIQEEALFFGKPVLVMREVTERPEGVFAGGVKLVGTNKDTLIKETLELLDNLSLYLKMSNVSNPYGDGKASDRIVKIIEDCFK